MFAKLTALVSGGPTLPYIVDEGSQEQAWGNWTHQRGTGREDGTAVSVFKITCPDPNDRRLVAGRNGVKRLKLVRRAQPPRVTVNCASAGALQCGPHIAAVQRPLLRQLPDSVTLSSRMRNSYCSTLYADPIH